jgi:hypothetical protein
MRDGKKAGKSGEKTAKKAYPGVLFGKISYVCK